MEQPFAEIRTVSPVDGCKVDIVDIEICLDGVAPPVEVGDVVPGPVAYCVCIVACAS